MLAHSPPLPLIVDYADGSRVLAAEDAQRICLVLRHRDRVRRIRLAVHETHLRNFVAAFVDKEFPMLEYLFIKLRESPSWPLGLPVRLPDTFQAPCLRHLVLIRFTFPITSPLLTTAIHLVSLSLNFDFVGYCHHNDLLKQLALLPLLETLGIVFHLHVRDNRVEEQASHTLFITHVTLPNLRWFVFQGTSAYLEALLPGMTTPPLEKLKITLFGQLTLSTPSLLVFMNTATNLSFSNARFHFYSGGLASVRVYHHEEARIYALYVQVFCGESDQQLSFMAQLSDVLSPVFSAVVDLTISHYLPSTQHNEANYTQWRKLLGSFSNVKTLRMPNVFIEDLCRSLRSDGEPPLELLPKLQVLVCPVGSDMFNAFVNARNVAGHPVRLSTR
jgi:hypothetical protein